MQTLAEGEYSSHPDVSDLPGDGVVECKKQGLLKSYRTFHEALYHAKTPGQYKTHVEVWVCEYIAIIKMSAKTYADGKQARCTQIDTGKVIKSLKNGGRYTDKEKEDN